MQNDHHHFKQNYRYSTGNVMVQEGWPLRTVAKIGMDILAVGKLLLIIRSVVHKSMHACILPQAADSNFIRTFQYICTCERHTLITVLNYGPIVSMDQVQFFSMFYFFLLFIFLTRYQNSCLQKIPHLLFSRVASTLSHYCVNAESTRTPYKQWIKQ